MIPLRDNVPSRSTPYVVYLLIALNALAFALEIRIGLLTDSAGRDLTRFLYFYGVVPARYSTGTGYFNFFEQILPFFTSLFLHGGIFHFLGNMWFLWIFGDNVEDWLGHGKFFLFYFFCGIAAGLLHVATNWTSNMPTIGASGAVAGVMGAYFLLYPKARVVTLVPIIIFFQIMELPAFLFLGLWFALQFLQGMAGGAGQVAWWAHIGGFACGAATVVLLGGKRFFFGGGPRRGGSSPGRGSSSNIDRYW